jgi:hypothetical protein
VIEVFGGDGGLGEFPSFGGANEHKEER